MEEKIYTPNELYFSIIDYKLHIKGVNPSIVFITPIEYYSEYKVLSDSFTSADIDPKNLEKAGLSEVELLESIFEVADPSATKEEIHQNLLNAGFIFNEEFDNFCNSDSE